MVEALAETYVECTNAGVARTPEDDVGAALVDEKLGCGSAIGVRPEGVDKLRRAK